MRKYILAGLATLLPVAVTLYIVVWVVGFLTSPFMGIVTDLLSKLPFDGILMSEPVIRGISEILILIAIFLFIVIFGLIARWFFVNWILRLSDRILHRIPMINKVYKTTKEIIQVLFASNQNTFKQVVLVRFPNNESFCLGLIARNAPEACKMKNLSGQVSVFIPTTPNPTTGYLIVCPESELIYLDMKSEDAVKYIVSCGVVQPASAR